MARGKLLLGGTAAVGIRLARTLYARWRFLAPAERARLEPLAADAKERALELRGATDRQAAERGLRAANESLAAAIVESAEADPELSELELSRLREDLRRELRRLASVEIRAAEGAAPEPDVRQRSPAG